MKKKILAVLSLVLIGAMVFAFASCKGNGSDTTTGTGTTGTGTTGTGTTGTGTTGAGTTAAAATLKEWDTISESKKLIIGITDYEPMDYQDADEKWIGFDADLANAVCKKLGIKAEFKEITNWDNNIIELNSKSIDCIWNGFTIDADRSAKVSFSQKYMKNKQAIVIRGEDASKYTDLASLATATLTAEGTTSAGAKAIQANATLKAAKYVESDGQTKALQELIAKTSDAAVIDYTMANYLINKSGSSFSSLKILEIADFADTEYYGIGFRKGSDLTAKVDAVIDELQADGTVKAIAEKYGLADALVNE